jgi:hypothetical protein
MNYVVEVKSLENFSTKAVDLAITQLMSIEEHINLNPLKLVLIIATKKKLDVRLLEVYQNIKNLTIYFFQHED